MHSLTFISWRILTYICLCKQCFEQLALSKAAKVHEIGMKKFTTLLLLACMFQQLDTQNDSVPLTSLKEQEKLDKANSRRTQELSFSRQTLNYSPRSYVCPPYFDLGSPKKWYIFSVDIIPDFIISGSRMPVTIHLVARYITWCGFCMMILMPGIHRLRCAHQALCPAPLCTFHWVI